MFIDTMALDALQQLACTYIRRAERAIFRGAIH
jgi:hypothetical protein